jgi:beta-glucanase (GH16 family)
VKWGLAVVLVLVGCTSSPPTVRPVPVPEGWKLVFADDFDRLDTARWAVSTHTFDGNAARFRPENVVVKHGVLTLAIRKRRSADREYAAGEIQSRASYQYGRFEVRMRAAAGSGVISSFFHYRASPWQEIDIEFLGRRPTAIQANLYNSPTTAPVDVEPFPQLHDLAFDAAADFHIYAIEWDPAEIRWYVDGTLVDRTRDPSTVPRQPLHLALNCWPSTAESWAGALDDGALPARADYDWVRVYERAPHP